MHKNFGAKDQSTIVVCTFLPCGGSWRRCIPHIPNMKMVKKGGRKRGKSGGATNKYTLQIHHSNHQHQQQHHHQQQNQHFTQHYHHHQQHYQHNNQPNQQNQHQNHHKHQPNHQHHQRRNSQKVNLHGKIIDATNVENFGNIFTTDHTQHTMQVVFQNCGTQPKSNHSYKAKQALSSMSTGNYDVILVAEHGLNQKNIEVDHSW